ncbi:MAG: Asp/Glu racemase [Paracoccaceae bacterium]|nr:Asp/Glu racemase [Paracoccaceae bacterium]MDG1738462.1 Asp/Glu racemase [Paracoccaceae bacterium]MDG2259791.1 Asp/Glu racemase [Paracoccaceae bacterium]
MKQTRGRARFGILVPFTNTNLEPDMTLLWPEGVSMHFARMGGYDQEEIPDAEQMHGLGASDLDGPLHLLQGVNPDVILYGCTSATLTHGPTFDRELAARIKADSGAETVTAAGALVHAIKTLGADRIGFASPYVSAINDMAVGFLGESGIETVSRSEVGTALDNYGQRELNPDTVFELGLAADHPDATAIVLSCTDMRSVEIIARLEQAVGKPVITSNQAMIFQAMQLAGFNEALPGYGLLLEGAR